MARKAEVHSLTKIGVLIRSFPEMHKVFHRFGIDPRREKRMPLGEAAVRHHLPLTPFFSELTWIEFCHNFRCVGGEMSVQETVSRYPATAAIFAHHRLSLSSRPIRSAAEGRRLDPGRLLRELNAAAR